MMNDKDQARLNELQSKPQEELTPDEKDELQRLQQKQSA